MERVVAVGVSIVLVTCLLVATGVSGRQQSSFDDPSDFGTTIYYVEVYDNGSVHWTAQYQTILENDTETEMFQRFVERFRRNETPLYTMFERQVVTDRVGQAENVTGREMDAIAFSRAASVETQAGEGENATLGIVEMSFIWTNATVREGRNVVFGDVFEGGLYLDSHQSLVVLAGDGLRFDSVSPMESAVVSNASLNESESVTWTGELQFADRRPRVVLGPEEPPPGPSPDLTWMMVGLLVALLGLGAALLWRQVGVPTRRRASTNGSREAEPAVADEELLSDETRVEQLLADHGNRMKQVDIVEETGWSKAKVSTLLSDMAEEGRISKLRIGRENIITLESSESVVDSSTEDGAS